MKCREFSRIWFSFRSWVINICGVHVVVWWVNGVGIYVVPFGLTLAWIFLPFFFHLMVSRKYTFPSQFISHVWLSPSDFIRWPS